MSDDARPPGTLRLGSIAGVPVLVRSSWLLVAALIAVLWAPRIDLVAPGLGGWRYAAGLAFAALLYLSVLLHEAAHAVAARAYGLPVRAITLHFLGGVTEIEREPRKPLHELVIAVVGPLVSLGLGVVFLGLWWVVSDDGLVGLTLEALALANLVVGLLNLVPGLPLDGGRVLRAGVWQLSGDAHRGTVVAAWGGRVVAGLVLTWPFVADQLLVRGATIMDSLLAVVVAVFLWAGASASLQQARVRRRLTGFAARDHARPVVAVPPDLPLSEALRRADQQGGAGVVTVGDGGALLGVLNGPAVAATPAERRPWVPVGQVTRAVDDGLQLDADVAGEDLVRALQACPATEYVLVEPDGAVVGVVHTADLDRAFAARARSRSAR
ncbi:MAG: site-2 protease family protein [Nocardioides sp.]|nr:site-2 protease family protein [Nocardioides sp.]